MGGCSYAVAIVRSLYIVVGLLSPYRVKRQVYLDGGQCTSTSDAKPGDSVIAFN